MSASLDMMAYLGDTLKAVRLQRRSDIEAARQASSGGAVDASADAIRRGVSATRRVEQDSLAQQRRAVKAKGAAEAGVAKRTLKRLRQQGCIEGVVTV